MPASPLPLPRTRITLWVPLLIAGALLIIVSALAYLYHHDPEASGPSLLPSCRLYQLTGLKCAGCGMTRATHHLLHGRIGQAFYYNPLYLLSLPLFLFWAVKEIRRLWKETELSEEKWQQRIFVSWAIISVIIGYSIVRNFSWWPWF